MRRAVAVALATVALTGCGSSATLDEREQAQDEQIAAVIDCMRNNAYSRELLGQCIDDWFDSNATVDY